MQTAQPTAPKAKRAQPVTLVPPVVPTAVVYLLPTGELDYTPTVDDLPEHVVILGMVQNGQVVYRSTMVLRNAQSLALTQALEALQ